MASTPLNDLVLVGVKAQMFTMVASTLDAVGQRFAAIKPPKRTLHCLQLLDNSHGSVVVSCVERRRQKDATAAFTYCRVLYARPGRQQLRERLADVFGRFAGGVRQLRIDCAFGRQFRIDCAFGRESEYDASRLAEVFADFAGHVRQLRLGRQDNWDHGRLIAVFAPTLRGLSVDFGHSACGVSCNPWTYQVLRALTALSAQCPQLRSLSILNVEFSRRYQNPKASLTVMLQAMSQLRCLSLTSCDCSSPKRTPMRTPSDWFSAALAPMVDLRQLTVDIRYLDDVADAGFLPTVARLRLLTLDARTVAFNAEDMGNDERAALFDLLTAQQKDDQGRLAIAVTPTADLLPDPAQSMQTLLRMSDFADRTIRLHNCAQSAVDRWQRGIVISVQQTDDEM